MYVIAVDDSRKVNVSGIDNHCLPDLDIVTAAAVLNSHKGTVIGIFHQYAHIATGKSIHSSGQLEHYKIDVNDKSLRVGGLQRIVTIDGYCFPLDIIDGLPYLKQRACTAAEFADPNIPHVVMTSDNTWIPQDLDCIISSDSQWYDVITDFTRNTSNPFDEFGNYRQRHGTTINQTPNTVLYDVNQFLLISSINAELHDTTPSDRDYISLQKFFLWKDVDVIKATYDNTTQYGRRRPQLGPTIRDTYKSPFPMFNVSRRQESVATDTILSSVLALGNYKYVQIFIGRRSNVLDIYPMRSTDEFPNTLQDVIRKRGAMDKLISDRASVEISQHVQDIMRALVIADWQSEPHHQHQNFAERHWQMAKRLVHVVMDRSGAPPELWLLCLEYVAFVLNRMSLPSLSDKAPLTVLTGQAPDISMIPIFEFYQKVYFLHYKSKSEPVHTTREVLGYFVGFAETVGHAFTYKVLHASTRKILFRSRLRIVKDGEKNLRAEPNPDHKPGKDGSTPDKHTEDTGPTIPEKPPFELTSPYDQKMADGQLLPTLEPEMIVGRSFLLPPEPDGTRLEATAVELIQQYEEDLYKHPDHIKFRCTVNDKEYEDLISYSQVIDYLEDDKNKIWKFNKIVAHQGPLKKGDVGYKGSMYNLLVEWEGSHEQTSEPLHHMVQEDWMSVVEYCRMHNLLNEKGFKHLRGKARSKEFIDRKINATKIHAPRFSPVYMFGIRVPRNHSEAMTLDRENGNSKWADAKHVELTSIQGFQSFRNHGHKDNTSLPNGYKKITVHMVYAVKHDGRHKARLVAGGHLTDTPVESVYSSVVSLKGVRLTTFVAELNGLQTWSTDVGNAYLESYTKEKVCFIAGPEFAPFGLEGHILIIVRALYGLKSSGARWWERLADVLWDMDFFPSKAETDIWMRRIGDHYEYICVYVDDLVIASMNPQAIVDDLQTKHKFNLKGTGPIHYHLGCDYFRDHTDTLCYAPRRYVDKMVADYTRMFGEKPKAYSSPIDKGDHPEVDTSDLLDLEGIKQYQSIIGSLQWAVQLGRLDVTTAVMTMSSFRTAPRLGHLNRLKRIMGYLARMRNATVRIRTGLPDYSDIPEAAHLWDKSIYRGAKELIPEDIPEPLGKPVICTAYVDANLYHDLLTGRSVTGVLHFVNQTPVDWYSKKQATVETATYGSEFVAAKTATEQIIGNRMALRYLGIEVIGPTFLFGDNGSVIASSTVAHSQLNRRHMALAFHKLRESIAARILRFDFLNSEDNPADVLSKHWAYQTVSKLIHLLLFLPTGPFDNLADDDPTNDHKGSDKI